MKWSALFVLFFSFAAQHRVNLEQPPWRDAMATFRAHGDLAARPQIEQIAEGPGLEAWQRAYAWRWAGMISYRHDQFDLARRDFERSRAADPTGFDGRMSSELLGEIAMHERRWFQAMNYLRPIEHDPDPVIRAYAQDRLSRVRQRVPRLVKRYASITIVTLGAILLAARLILRRKHLRAKTFGRALLVTELVAIVATGLVPRFWTQLAQSGFMAAAIPSALFVAAAWASRAPEAAWWKKALVLVALCVWIVAGFYLAIDVTWWSVEDPLM